MYHTTHVKKRLLFLITKSNWGGAQRYVYDIATDLPSDHFQVTVAFGGHGMLADRLEQAGVRTVALPYSERDISLWREIALGFSLWSLFRRERPDIAHLNSSKIGGTGALAARLAGIPKIVFTAHGWAFEEDRSLVSKKIRYFLSWFTSLLATDVIVITSRAKIFHPAKTHFIPMGI